MNKSIKIILIILIILVLATTYWFFFYDDSTAGEKVDYIQVTANFDNIILRASGIVVPERTVEIKSSIAEKVVKVVYREGNFIEKEDLLIEYDNQIAKSNIKQARINEEKLEVSLLQSKRSEEEAESALELVRTQLENVKETSFVALKKEIEQAKINLENAEKKLNKYTYLYENGSIELSKKEEQQYQFKLYQNQLDLAQQRLADKKREVNNKIEEFEKSVSQAQKRYLIAQKNCELAEKSLQDAEILLEKSLTSYKKYFVCSPINGKVIKKNIEEGEYVQPGQLLYRIISDNLLIKISPDERELALLTRNKTGYIAPEAYPDKKIKVKLERIAPAVDNERGTIDVYFKPVEKTDILLPNMTVSVDIIDKNMEEGKIYIPQSYLTDGSKVFLAQEGRVVLREIITGIRIEDKIEITNGLKAGDIILKPDNIEIGQEINIEG